MVKTPIQACLPLIGPTMFGALALDRCCLTQMWNSLYIYIYIYIYIVTMDYVGMGLLLGQSWDRVNILLKSGVPFHIWQRGPACSCSAPLYLVWPSSGRSLGVNNASSQTDSSSWTLGLLGPTCRSGYKNITNLFKICFLFNKKKLQGS